MTHEEKIAAKLDANGLPALELHSSNRKHQENLKIMGWRPYQMSEPPKGAKKTTSRTKKTEE